MKKELLESMGISEEHWKSVKAEYWADVNKIAQRKVKEYERQHTNTAVQMREAITAIITLINDTEKLQNILSVANRQYYKQCQEQERERLKLIRKQIESVMPDPTESSEMLNNVEAEPEAETMPEETEVTTENVNED